MPSVDRFEVKCGGAECACPVDTVATLQTINTDAGPKAIHVVCVYVYSVNSLWVQYYSTTNVYGIYPWNYFDCEQQLAVELRKRQTVDIKASVQAHVLVRGALSLPSAQANAAVTVRRVSTCLHT